MDRAGTVIARHDPSELVTSVTSDGEVLVQGLRAGVLRGFRFRPDDDASEGSRALRAAANRALRDLVRGQVQELERAPDAPFSLGPGAELHWRGSAVATLVAGESALSPRVEVLGSDLLDAPLKERVRRRLAAWLEIHVRAALAPLLALSEEAPPGAARGLAFALAEGLGAVARRQVAKQVNALSIEERKALARLGVSLGRLVVFLPALQRAEPMRLRARLFGIRAGVMPEIGPDGIPSAANDPSRPAGFFLACGYVPAGPRVVRLDRLERAAALVSRLSRTGRFVPPRELPGILGCREGELGAVLGALGYAERDGQFERRQPARAPRHGRAR